MDLYNNKYKDFFNIYYNNLNTIMKYLKLYEEFNQDLIDKLIEDTKRTGEEHGVKIIFENSESVPYIVGGFPCSGYFVDYVNPTLAVAMGKPKEEFAMVIVHESCHMDQWIEKSPPWNNNFIDGKESVDYIDEGLSGKEFTPEELDNFIRRSIEVESDCERRTIEKAKSYNLPINIEEETQKANSYILFYSMLKEVRKWNVSGKAPYQIKEVWSQMPKTFDMDYYNVPENLKELYLKYCFD